MRVLSRRSHLRPTPVHHGVAVPDQWKIVLAGLAVALPLGAFVVGSLVASAADTPPARDTIVIQDPSATPAPARASVPAATGAPTPSASPPASPSASPPTSASAAPRDTGSTSGDDGAEDITPGWDDLDQSGRPSPSDQADDHGGTRDDEHSGHGPAGGGGSDDGSGRSGSGSSHGSGSGSGSSGHGSGSSSGDDD